jgi:hypothetical protein
MTRRRLTRLVSTLMDVSRLEAGRLKGSFRLVNLGLVTRDLAVGSISHRKGKADTVRHCLGVLSSGYGILACAEDNTDKVG